jgi:multiple sugar transport system substrate-binding protein
MSANDLTPNPEQSPTPTSEPNTGISRRELFRRGGKLAVATAVTSTFFPFAIHVRAAKAKTLSFWQFYAPTPNSAQSKWFEDAVKAWNDQNETKVQLQYVPNQEYMNGSKLQTAFASGQGPDIFIISPGDFLRYYNGGVLVDLSQYTDAAA